MAKLRGEAEDAALFAAAAALIRAEQIDSDAHLGSLLESPPSNIDPDILRHLRYMYEAGGWVILESAIADLPSDLRWLFESGAVTIEQLGALHDSLRATSVADLIAAVRLEAVRCVSGLGAEAEAAIADALPRLRKDVPRIPLGRAVSIAEPIIAQLKRLPGVVDATPAGSLRRGQDTVGDIEIVAPTSRPAEVLGALTGIEDMRVLYRGADRLYLRSDRTQIGIRLPPPERAGGVLLHLTGSAAHVQELARLAASGGWVLEPDGLRRVDGQQVVAENEAEIYAALGLPFIPAELRNEGDEFVAARAGALPELVTRSHIRGDLHMHSEWSDGRDPIEAMVQACAVLGYEYLAITDHSPHSSAARNLLNDGVARQADEFAALRHSYPEVTNLHSF